MYDVVKTATFQDYTAESTLRGLISAGRSADAICLARDYTSRYRRDRSEISIPLAGIIGLLSSPQEEDLRQAYVDT
jgi:hypothetical protein